MPNNPQFSNHLIGEKSPYLLQHANNPVHWHPWGNEAWEKAKAENKLVIDQDIVDKVVKQTIN